MKGGIYPVVADCRAAIRRPAPISLAGERRKLLNYGRENRPSDNWDKVGHECEAVNLVNGFSTVGSPAEVAGWWEWLFAETSLWRDEVNSRTYGGSQFEPELTVASLALRFEELSRLRPLIEDRMMAWLGALVPDVVDRRPREIDEHFPERKGTAVYGRGRFIENTGLCWVGMGDRSWVLDRNAAPGKKPERLFLDRNPIGALVAIVLRHPTAERADLSLERDFAARGIELWRPTPAVREVCLRALAGDTRALEEAFSWRNRCPHLYAHKVIGGRAAGNAAWTIFPDGKDGSTGAGAAAYSAQNGEGYMSPLSGERGSSGSDDDVEATTCVERDLPTGRAAVAWRDDAPHRLIDMGLPERPDHFRYESGPAGHRLIGASEPGSPTAPPAPAPPPPTRPPRPPKPPWWRRTKRAMRRWRQAVAAWEAQWGGR